MLFRVAVSSLALSTFVLSALGDPNDWVAIQYVVAQANQQSIAGYRSVTTSAQATIARHADNAASQGPWSVTNAKDVLAPSKDPHDYLSWAPYHWPNCNWCTQAGSNHIAHTVDGDNGSTSESNPGSGYSNEGTNEQGYYNGYHAQSKLTARRNNRMRRSHKRIIRNDIPAAASQSTEIVTTIASGLHSGSVDVHSGAVPFVSSTSVIDTPAPNPTTVLAPTITSTTSDAKTRGPAQAAAKSTKTSCTPSPTKSLAPSATWTTCPYVGRDGQVNPDVRTLNGPDAINSASQAVLLNAVAYALKKTASYSQNVVHFIDVFFLTASTKMNPNMNYGQIVRGPGPDGIAGTFTGVLDLRGVVKVANAISILKAVASPDWTQAREQAMNSWFYSYSNWLTNSDIGKMTSSRPNNHGTFFISQVVAVGISAGDKQGAITLLQRFFTTLFLDQLAASGEQPFEAVRTRPYHYRCFNLEALITNAKLGDELGLDLWSSKSKYGATIQTALDFLLAKSSGDEDISEVLPHVASVAAAYGDPKGKYTAFLKKTDPNYQDKSYWFYDQTSALSNSPASRMKSRSVSESADSSGTNEALTPVGVSFECPAVFRDVTEVEIDNGVFVTCDELRPFFESSGLM
ncbi:alginate lyase-domain-containing protein [Crassisporium funariophilum]|nr:alginate lyase-domain-containing protein [Crassisporium funariophilum]